MKQWVDTNLAIDWALDFGEGRPPSCPRRPRRLQTISLSCYGSKQMPRSESVSQILVSVLFRGLIQRNKSGKKQQIVIDESERSRYISAFFSMKCTDLGVDEEKFSKHSEIKISSSSHFAATSNFSNSNYDEVSKEVLPLTLGDLVCISQECQGEVRKCIYYT